MLELDDRPRERAVLVGLGDYRHLDDDYETDESFEELRLLAATAGAQVVGTVIQARREIRSTYYIGSGKAEELKAVVEEGGADLVIFDNDLTPAQVSNLQKLLDVKVIDRSGLILDIFSLRARTRQARTQVELAQLKYLLPRLTRHWTHLSRQQGGIGTRGPGETQLEVDRRSIRTRINHLTAVLKKIEQRQETARKNREQVFRVALVGYTNAGKSTLLNALSGAGVAVEDKLFKTLDSVTRHVRFGDSPDILLSDTVGFIRNLPHDLVASFHSTLAEVRDADLLLQVIDVTGSDWRAQHDVVDRVLAEIGVSDKKMYLVFNKIDRVGDDADIAGLARQYPNSVFVSAAEGTGLDELRERILSALYTGQRTITRTFSPSEGPLLSEVYRYATVHDTAHDGDSIILTFSLPASVAGRLGLDR